MVQRPINSALKREYHLQIKEYLISENFKYNVIGDLGCGYAYPTLDFSIIDNKKLFLFDGYSEDNEQFYFTKQEIKEEQGGGRTRLSIMVGKKKRDKKLKNCS